MQQNGCDEYLYNGTELDQYKQCGVIPNSIGTSYWEYSYDNRGNLTGSNKYTRTTEGMKMLNVAAYVYDETNRLVSGKNEDGEYSLYTYNGLGVRVGRELIMQDNTHGYTDFHDLTPSVETGLNKPEVVKESYVVDYTTATRETLTMHEEGGFDYRWVYGLDRLSVKVTSEGTNWWGQNVKQDILKDYAHQDRMGSTTNLTDQFGRVVGRADYNEWGELTYKEELNITSAYRRIYPQASYTGHDWDDVLGMYYAKARFYDPAAKRFVAMDPIKGNVADPLSLVPYIYCVDNPLKWVDPLGLMPQTITINGEKVEITEEMAQTLVEQIINERLWQKNDAEKIALFGESLRDYISLMLSNSLNIEMRQYGKIEDQNFAHFIHTSDTVFEMLYGYDPQEVRPGAEERAAKNYAINKKAASIPEKKIDENNIKRNNYIVQQGYGGQADNLRYGTRPMSYNGCEVIAAYNALLDLGEHTDIRELMRHFEVHGISFSGEFGTSIYAIADYFEKAGFCTKLIKPAALDAPTYDFDAELSYGQAGILTYWTKPDSLYIHTIMIKRTSPYSSEILAYNYGASESITFESIAKLIDNKKSYPISLITIDAKQKPVSRQGGGSANLYVPKSVAI